MMRALLFGLLLAATGAAAGAAQRVATLAPHLAELVCAAGGCAQLVGVARYSDFPPAVENLPQIGDAFAVNAEALLALKPDLVLSWDGGTPAATVERLAALGLRVEPVAVRGLDDVAQALMRVGQLLGTAEAAHAAAENYRQRLASLAARYRNRRPLRVMYQIEADPAYSINHLSPISDAIVLCGGINVFAGMSQLAAPVGKEAMLAADPEVVVFGSQDMPQEIRAMWAAFPQAAAQRNGNLYELDAGLLARPSPRILDGVAQLCAAIDAARQRKTK